MMDKDVEGKIEPNSDTRAFASAMSGMYVALRKEGFDSTEALYLTGSVFRLSDKK